MVGGAAHYGALILSWRRQRDFVSRYIRHARKAAWGNETGIAGIPGLNGAYAAAPAPQADEEEPATVHMNRKQKRQVERERKKDKSSKGMKAAGGASGTQTPPGNATRPGDKKRVMAENGKVLIVDSTGNVYLEEEDEDGTNQEYLLDLDQIPRPTIRDTALYRLPVWLYRKATGRFQKSAGASPAREEPELTTQDDSQEQDSGSSFEIIPRNGGEKAAVPVNSKAKKRNRKSEN